MQGRRLLIWCAGLGLLLLGLAIWFPFKAEPRYVEILSVSREPQAPVPPASRMRDEGDLVTMLLTVRRADLALLARSEATFKLVQFTCGGQGRSYYGSELYLDGTQLRSYRVGAPSEEEHVIGRQGAFLAREAAATGKGDHATIVAIMPRIYANGRGEDIVGAPCMRLETRPTGDDDGGAVRIPPDRAVTKS